MGERLTPASFPLPKSPTAKNPQFSLSPSCGGSGLSVGGGLAFGAAHQMNNFVSSPGRPRSVNITMNMCGGSEPNPGHANAPSTIQLSPKSRKRKPSFSDDECMDIHSSSSSASPIPEQTDEADENVLNGKKRAKVGGAQKLPLQKLHVR